MGPGGERLADAVAHRHRLSALRDDAGEARHDEELERLADILHIPALHPGHAAYARRPGQSVHAFAQSSIGNWFVGFYDRTSPSACSPASCSATICKSEHRLESLVSRESSFLFNNLVSARRLLHHSLGHAVSRNFGVSRQATKSRWARRFITGWDCPSACSCSSSPASVRCWRGAARRSERAAQLYSSHCAGGCRRHCADRRRRSPLAAISRDSLFAGRLLARRPWSSLPSARNFCAAPHVIRTPDRSETPGVGHGAADPPQHAPLRRLHRPLRRCR